VAVSVGRLIEIGDTTAWPNGSESLPQSITEIYDRIASADDRVKSTADKIDLTTIRLESYIVAHRADHGLQPPE
jgi:hypothetical protein